MTDNIFIQLSKYGEIISKINLEIVINLIATVLVNFSKSFMALGVLYELVLGLIKGEAKIPTPA